MRPYRSVREIDFPKYCYYRLPSLGGNFIAREKVKEDENLDIKRFPIKVMREGNKVFAKKFNFDFAS